MKFCRTEGNWRISLGFFWRFRDQIEGEPPGERVFHASQESMALLITSTLNRRVLGASARKNVNKTSTLFSARHF
jgi:hypothetical protein